uniref:Uncharacterized protein n=1 Tax=Oryza sativa subsp. japonica TaxID=39947 RepID=Q10NY3_ORYSJ|nr:hypothetical protein LOC_Os03g14968 [Oryza sativa Japonica Group]
MDESSMRRITVGGMEK